MSTWRVRWLATATAVGVLLSGCAPAPVPTPPAGPAAASSPAFATSWTGTPEEKSPTWAANLDPDSEFGLHRRQGFEPVLKPETMVLDAAATAGLTEVLITNSEACLAEVDSHPICRFQLDFATVPEGIEVGSVLNAPITKATPNGLLVKVTGIEGNRVEAVQATLLDALVQGEFWHEQAFDTENLRAEPTLAAGVKVVPRKHPGLRRSAPLQAPQFDELSLPGQLSIDVEPVDGVRVSGTIDFGAGCGLDGGVGGSDIAWLEFACQAWESASLAVESTASGPVSSERYPVAYFPLAAFPIPIGPLVVVVVADILVTVDLSGSVHVGLQYSGNEYAKVHGGLKFSLGNGLDHDGGVKTSAGGHGGGLKQDASITALGRSELRLSAYGVLGFAVGGDASLILSGGPKQNPRWRLAGNAGIFVKIFLGLLGFELSAQLAYHLKQPFLIASGGNADPKISITWPDDGTVITLGGLAPRPLEATALDPEDGVLPVRWQDLTEGSSVEGVGPLILPLKQVGTHKLRVSAIDSEGALVERTLSVTVKQPSLTLSLQLLRPDGTPLALPAAGKAGGSVLVEATLKSGQLTPPSCAGLKWTATNAQLTTDGSCRARLALGEPGTATVEASLVDQFGTPAKATTSLKVTAAASTVTPEFLGIDATAGGHHLTSGATLIGAQPIQLQMNYLNQAQAKITPRYEWWVSVAGGPEVELPGPGTEVLSSTRSFTPPSPWGHRASFTVVIRDAASNAELTTRTFALTWQSAPK